MYWQPGLPPDMGKPPKSSASAWPFGKKCVEALSSKAIGPAPEMEPSTMGMDVNKVTIQSIPFTQTKKRNLGNTKLTTIVTNEGKKKQKEKTDYHLMKCIVCCGIPPKVVDSAEWKSMMAALNPYYQPPSSTTLMEKLIINEAAKITAAKFLSGCRNLTITFDGGKIQRPKSTYSVHVTTATHHAFCMELDDASQLSHTAKYILEVLECMIAKIGPWNFCAATSDNTGNTQKA
ncbi:hypothetical protein EDD17DRAFT_1509102 [Pisolithus thermaeus]|nr:hypothetical protein EDD17DRAFT_1509102 [Pisolithus thermaeus]